MAYDTAPDNSRWRAARDVLCVRLDAMGDVLMTTPALRALRDAAEGRRITLLTSPSGAAIACMVPEVDDVIVYDAPWLKATAPRIDSAPDHAMLRQIRDRRFDAAVIFTVFSQNPLPAALFCYLADIPLRAAHCRENPYQLLTTWLRETEPEEGIAHEVERQCRLVAALGARAEPSPLSLTVSAQARERTDAALACAGIDPDGTWFVVHPGATAPSRRYPPERFTKAVARVQRETGATVVLTGDAGERALAEEIREALPRPAISLAGALSLDELVALIAAAPLLLTNNTGPAHIAAAVGTPVVVLYALTNPQHTPWRVVSRVLSHDVPCRNCFRSVCPHGHNACLTGIPPDDVSAAVLELLAARLTPAARAPFLPHAVTADVYAGYQRRLS